MEFYRECGCKPSCDKCTVELYLKVKNTLDETLDVTTEHIKPMKEDVSVLPVFYKDKNGEKEAPLLLLKLKKG